MKILQPFYYDDFKCIGDKCPNTCCAGWGITIDKKSFFKYKKLKSEFGKKVIKSIKRNKNNPSDSMYGNFILDEEKRCPLLNEEKLCDLYINEGEKYLCNTCKKYPREGFLYKNNLERNLSASCPVVARKLVYTKDKFSFEMKEENIDIKEESISYEFALPNREELFNMLWEGRNLSIDIAQMDEIPIWKRLIFIEFLEKRLQNLIDTKTISEYPQVLDNFSKEFINYINDNSIKGVNNVVKVAIISNILNANKEGLLHESMKELNNIFSNKTNEEINEILETEEAEFKKYFREREHIYENYIVYSLYHNYIRAIGNNDLHQQVVMTIIDYAILKLVLFSFWYKDKSLEDEQIVDIISQFARRIEHNHIFIEELYKWARASKIDTPGFLATIIY